MAEHRTCRRTLGDGLLTLMYLHAARFDTQLDGHGVLLLLEDQDRSKWDRRLIQQGYYWLGSAGRGEVLSRYYAEACVLAVRCGAASYAEINWREIVDLYETLERFDPSPQPAEKALLVRRLKACV